MNRLFAYLHRKSRQKKYRMFERLLRPSSGMRLLNVGATGARMGLAEQLEAFYPYPERIAGGGLRFEDVQDYARSFPAAQAVAFDGCALPFPDQSFDVVYSNAVLEHLPSWEAQRRFAAEVERVGRGWFVSTPNFWYPIESHYHLPFIQFLPLSRQPSVARMLGKTPYPVLRLLSRREMRQLFRSSQVIGCRVTFYAETLIAYRRTEDRESRIEDRELRIGRAGP